MPSTVAGLLDAVDLDAGGCVSWGEPVPETRTGVYLVALTGSVDRADGVRPDSPLSEEAIDELLQTCPDITLDGEPANRKLIAQRLSSYWLPDECVLYIGLAGQPLRTRVRQYYRTPLGAAKPHKGGWWLKTLSILDELWVHYAATPEFEDAEADMLRAFAAGVSQNTREQFPPGKPIMPFANLRDGDWRLKGHGIRGATAAAPKRGERRSAPVTGRKAQPSDQPITSPEGSIEPHLRTQPVTAKDIEAGRIRIPRGPTKAALPGELGAITVALREHTMECRWDPRFGPPERSGVITVGRAVAREHLTADETLRVRIAEDGVVRLG